MAGKLSPLSPLLIMYTQGAVGHYRKIQPRRRPPAAGATPVRRQVELTILCLRVGWQGGEGPGPCIWQAPLLSRHRGEEREAVGERGRGSWFVGSGDLVHGGVKYDIYSTITMLLFF